MFITFEGIEGCGKSTQCRLAGEWLSTKGVEVCSTREPGGTQLGVQIRKILLSEGSTELQPVSEALLYMADRIQHVQQVIKPALKKGAVVLCDRYHDSTVAYQGYARRIPLDWIEAVWKGSGCALQPDLTLLFDIEPQIGIRRSLQKLQREQIDESRFEKEAIEFHTHVRDGFLTLARLHKERFVILNGDAPVEEIHEQVIRALQSRMRL